MTKYGKRNKYGAKKTVRDGITFASSHEADHYSRLKLLERAGEIKDLERQVPIMLEGRDGPLRTRTGQHMRLTVDFRYKDKALGWATVWADSKGAITRDYEVRKAVAEAMGYTIVEM